MIDTGGSIVRLLSDRAGLRNEIIVADFTTVLINISGGIVYAVPFYKRQTIVVHVARQPA